jgi:hypothetical protein
MGEVLLAKQLLPVCELASLLRTRNSDILSHHSAHGAFWLRRSGWRHTRSPVMGNRRS